MSLVKETREEASIVSISISKYQLGELVFWGVVDSSSTNDSLDLPFYCVPRESAVFSCREATTVKAIPETNHVQLLACKVHR